jgi:hypothetical protein
MKSMGGCTRFALLVLVACGRPPTTQVRQQIDLNTPWTMHTLIAGASSGTHVGADGVDVRAGVAVVPWEQGNSVTTTAIATGATTTYTLSQSGPEDARLCDLDKDGIDDIVIASSGKKAVYVIYGGTTTWVQVTASLLHGAWIQVACVDVDGNGNPDIVGGSYAGTPSSPAMVGVLYNSGSRNGASFTFQQITTAGWAMSVLPADMNADGIPDLVVTDRAAQAGPYYGLMGARWEEQTRTGGAPTWTNHTMLGAPYTGDEMFGLVVDYDHDGTLDVIEGRSHTGQASTIAVHGSTSATLYSDTETGRHYQGADIGDVDEDGRDDLVVSTWESNACCSNAVSGVYWLRNTGSGYVLGKIADGPGTKYDNALLYDVDGDGDLDVLDTEQVNQQGLVWYENPLAPVAVDGPPDAAVDAPHECGAP